MATVAPATVADDTPSSEEKDQLHRSVKKFKRRFVEDLTEDVDMGQGGPASPGPELSGAGVWSGVSFADKVRAPVKRPPIYTGEDEVDNFDETYLPQIGDMGVGHEGSNSSPWGPIVHIPVEDYQEAWKPWKRGLIIKLLGKTISLRTLKHRVESLWHLQWGCDIVDLEEGYFVARFRSRDDYLKVLENGPWIILGHYLTITKWRPFFRPKEVEILSALIWVRLPGIPLECFTEKILMAVAKSIGRPVRVDGTTREAERGKYAKICVEVDLARPLVPSVCLDGNRQPVEYEGLYQICFRCGQYGHRAETCPVSSVVTSGAAEGDSSEIDQNGVGVEEGYYGPWMLPNRGRRRNVPQHNRGDRAAVGVSNVGSGGRVSAPVRFAQQPEATATQNFVFSAQFSESQQGRDPKQKQNKNGNQSRFSVLENLDNENSAIEEVQVLKEKLRQLQSPGSGVDRSSKENASSSGGKGLKAKGANKGKATVPQNMQHPGDTVVWTKVFSKGNKGKPPVPRPGPLRDIPNNWNSSLSFKGMHSDPVNQNSQVVSPGVPGPVRGKPPDAAQATAVTILESGDPGGGVHTEMETDLPDTVGDACPEVRASSSHSQ